MHYAVSFRLEPHPLHLTYSTKSLLLYTNDRGNDIDLVFGDHLFYEFFSKRCRSDTAKKKYSFQYKANGNDLSFAIAVLLVAKLFLRVLGAPVKQNFMGGSVHGAVTYLFTALLQEFLARGVIQTSVKNLMRVKHQIPVSIFFDVDALYVNASSLWFYFHDGCFLLSIALGILFEQQKNNLGLLLPTLEHRLPGTMCLFFLRSRHSSFPYPTISHGHILLIMSKAAIHFAVPRDSILP